MDSPKKVRSRKTNFSQDEMVILVDEGVEHHRILSAAFGPGVTKKSKDVIWQQIASKISANTAGVRSATEVRKKWNDMRCQVKKKAQMAKKEAGKTGGGPSETPDLNELDEKVLSTIPTCQVEGIDGGEETPICTEDQPPTPNLVSETCVEACLPQESAAAQGHKEVYSHPESTSATDSCLPPPRKLSKRTPSFTVSKPPAPVPATQRSGSSQHVGSLVKVEELKLEVLQKLLCVERERLDVERERLAIERDRLALERQRLELKEKLSINSSVEQFLTPVYNFE